MSSIDENAGRTLVAVAHGEAALRFRVDVRSDAPAIPTSLHVKAELAQLGVNMALAEVIRLCREQHLPLTDIREDGEEPTRKLPALRL